MKSIDYSKFDGSRVVDQLKDREREMRPGYHDLVEAWKALGLQDYKMAKALIECLEKIHYQVIKGVFPQEDAKFEPLLYLLTDDRDRNDFLSWVLKDWKDDPRFMKDGVDYSKYIPNELKPYADKALCLLEVEMFEQFIKTLPNLSVERFENCHLLEKIETAAKDEDELKELIAEATTIIDKGCDGCWNPKEARFNLKAIFSQKMNIKLLNVMVEYYLLDPAYENDSMCDLQEWILISKNGGLDDEFIRKYLENYLPPNFSSASQMSLEFIHELRDRLDWYYIIGSQQCLTREFIEEHRDNILNGNLCGSSDMVERRFEIIERCLDMYELKRADLTPEQLADPTVITREDIIEIFMLKTLTPEDHVEFLSDLPLKVATEKELEFSEEIGWGMFKDLNGHQWIFDSDDTSEFLVNLDTNDRYEVKDKIENDEQEVTKVIFA